MWHRRAFLSAAGATFAASLLPRRVEALERADLVFASAIQDTSGAFGAALVTERGELVAKVGLPQRGHDICFSPVNGTMSAIVPMAAILIKDSTRSPWPVSFKSACASLKATPQPARFLFGYWQSVRLGFKTAFAGGSPSSGR